LTDTPWPSDSALTDTKGREVDSLVFEFDACFDPKGDTTATDTVSSRC
jgi:hypothetical protein